MVQFENSDRPLLVIATHDCSLTGAPTVALNATRLLAASNAFDLLVVSFRGGPLASAFSSICPTEILYSGSPNCDVVQKLASILDPYRSRPHKFALCNTIVTAGLIPVFRSWGFSVVSLIHELPETIKSFGAHLFRLVDQQANAIVVGSEFVRSRITETFQPTNTNFLVVPTGYPDVPLDRDRINACRVRLRNEAGFSQDTLVVLGCGTVESRKGVDLFIQFAQQAASQPKGGQLRFVWIGALSSTAFCSWCFNEIRSRRLEHIVRFLGVRPDTSLYFPGADIFALTSREDPFPQVSLAAMSAQVPVLAFANAGGAPEAIEDDAGVVVPFLDVAAMANSALSLAADPERRKALGARGRSKFISRYTMDRFLANLFTNLRDSGIALPQVSFDAD